MNINKKYTGLSFLLLATLKRHALSEKLLSMWTFYNDSLLNVDNIRKDIAQFAHHLKAENISCNIWDAWTFVKPKQTKPETIISIFRIPEVWLFKSNTQWSKCTTQIWGSQRALPTKLFNLSQQEDAGLSSIFYPYSVGIHLNRKMMNLWQLLKTVWEEKAEFGKVNPWAKGIIKKEKNIKERKKIILLFWDKCLPFEIAIHSF